MKKTKWVTEREEEKIEHVMENINACEWKYMLYMNEIYVNVNIKLWSVNPKNVGVDGEDVWWM